MSSTTSKMFCVTCKKGSGQFRCEGCAQKFCMKHVVQHREVLNLQLDEIVIQHDILQQTTNETEEQSSSLFTRIELWERTSIEKIRQIAQEAREKLLEESEFSI
jgi:CMP-2-keto-3-deoxyoctulosonic acid synthetase